MERTVFVIVAFTVCVVAGIAGYTVKQEFAWQEFSELHECRLVHAAPEHMTYQSSFDTVTKTISLKPIRVSNEKIYICNDGNEYIR